MTFGLGNLAGAIVAWRIASRRLGGLAGHEISRTLVRMHLAALPALLFAWAVTFMVGVLLSGRPTGCARSCWAAAAGCSCTTCSAGHCM